jgi:hypothetical protein
VNPVRILTLAVAASTGMPACSLAASRALVPRPALVPLPPERPAGLGVPQAVTRPAPALASPSPAPGGATGPGAAPPVGTDVAACVRRLKEQGVALERLPPIALGPCGARDVFRLAALPDGVAVAPPITVTCAMADSLAGWSKDVVDAADHELHRRVSALATGTNYECRGQNHVATAKLSEHAFANALDLAGFRFATGAAVTVTGTPPDEASARFLLSVRASACRYFTTVLGPGSDPSHSDHLHLDMRQRMNGYRICQ